jgi:CHAT domain/SIR2-like domain
LWEEVVKHAELQISLQPWGAGGCEVELLYSDSESPGEQRLAGDTPRLATFDADQLRALALSPKEYGRALGRCLFADPEVRSFFVRGCEKAALIPPEEAGGSPGCPLQVRLHIGRRVAALHGLRWETLCDPRDDEFLATKETVVFSRYLSSPYYRPSRPRSQGEPLRVVVAVADPKDAADLVVGRRRRRLTPIRVQEELDRLRPALDPEHYEVTELAGPGLATLENLIDRVQQGIDILYLICHGELIEDAPWLWLVDGDNRAARTAGVELVHRLMELRQQPQMIVLASCQSAGGEGDEEARTDDNGALAALGPRLAEAGIPAVLAMQGNVTMRTVAAFMPAFFRALGNGSAVDVAAAAARRQGSVRDRPDCWMPALFTRLQSGHIWYTQGLEVTGRRAFQSWDGFLTNLERGAATAILGFGLLEPLLGSQEEVAGQWAQRYEYPLAPDRREDLTQVAQFLAVNQNLSFPGAELRRHLRRELLCRLEADRREQSEERSLNELLQETLASGPAAAGGPPDLGPHEVLAGLPFRVYLTTNADDLLIQALRKVEVKTPQGPVKKDPQVHFFDWQREARQWDEAAGLPAGPAPPEDEPIVLEKPNPRQPYARAAGVGRPPPHRPLVYYLFGHFDYPETLVLTEDNYIDYLISLTLNRGLIPRAVTSALADSALLFLGFRFDDWSFRVLFRSIMRLQGSRRLGQYTNIAVQIDPERDRIADPGMARRYLEDYFGRTSAQISVYWGSAQKFLRELHRRWQERQGGPRREGQEQ